MFPDAFVPLGQVPATANRLERAAGELRERAGSPAAVPSLPRTLGHVEAAFDHLAAAMRLLAEATAEWYEAEDEADLPPEASALLWHLRATADDLSDLRDGSAATRGWAGRLLDETATAPRSGVIMNMPTGQCPPVRRVVCGVDGSEQARHAATTALRLAERLGARLTLVHVTPTRTVMPVDSFPLGPDPSAFPHSSELAFSEAEAAFDSLSRDVRAASGVELEVRLGQPAAVLAQLAADCDAEMIVVGSRGRGAWRSAVLGSVSGDLARLAPCPVMIVPQGVAALRRTA